MDKRELSQVFRERLQRLLDSDPRPTAEFLRDARMDRSALSQFLDPDIDRLPRAEALRNMATARGVSVDWLLGIENAPEGRQELTPSFQIEQAVGTTGATPLDGWRAEAAGLKLRYVPTLLPDMLQLPSGEDGRQGGAGETILGGAAIDDTNIEIAMPVQTLENLVDGSGFWRGWEADKRRRQLMHIADLAAEHYPTLRLHLFDARTSFALPFTVFGRSRVAIYMGESYLVMTGPDQIRAMTRQFDRLVRQAIIGPDRVDRTLRELAGRIRRIA